MILYHAISTFQILEVSLHRLLFHRYERTILVLPDFIVEKHKDYFNLVQLGIFDEVYLFPYLRIIHDEEFIEKNILSFCKNAIPYDLKEFKKIYIAGIHFYFSLVLIKQKISFTAFEDAAGMIDKGNLMFEELKVDFPIHAKIANENGLFDFRNPNISEVIVQKINISVDKKQSVFEINDALNRISKKELNNILNFFHIQKIGEDVKDKDLLITERFSVIGTMSQNKQIELYKRLIKKELCEDKLIIKPHPDEQINYKEIFPKALVLPSCFPVELFPHIFCNSINCVCGFKSTAIETLGKRYVIRQFNLNDYMEEKMKIIGVIPARYKSSRFPGKPLVDICGKPMIWWVYQQCLKVSEIDELYIATDDTRIEAVCKEEGLNVIMTSDVHKTGSDRVGEVATKVDGDLFINIQGDEPCIEPEMIQQVIEIFKDDESVYFGSLRKEIKDKKEIEAYSTVKVVTDCKDDALYFSRNVIPSNIKDGILARVFRHVGIYAYKKDFLLKFVNMGQTELELGEGIEPLRAMENGYKIRVRETEFESIGVDLPEHVVLVEKRIREMQELENK